MVFVKYYKPNEVFYKDAFSRLTEGYPNISISQKDTLQLILEEWLTNLIKYSNFTFVNITFEAIDNNFKITFEDDGIPFNPLNQKPNTDFTIPGGLGISLMKSYSKEFKYNYTNDSTNQMYIIF